MCLYTVKVNSRVELIAPTSKPMKRMLNGCDVAMKLNLRRSYEERGVADIRCGVGKARKDAAY